MGKLLDILKANSIEITEDIEKKVMADFANKEDIEFKYTEIIDLNKQLETLQGKYKTDTDDLQSKLKDMEFSSFVDTFLTSVNAKDAGLIKTLLNRETLQIKDGKIEGLTEQVEQLRKEKEFLFNPVVEQQTQQAVYTYKPTSGSAATQPTTLNDAVAQAMGLTQ